MDIWGDEHERSNWHRNIRHRDDLQVSSALRILRVEKEDMHRRKSYDHNTFMDDADNNTDRGNLFGRKERRMKLYELLDVYDYNRESKIQKIQICRPNSDWEDWEEVLAGSVLLLPLYNAKVKDIGAAGENIIRVDIEWDKKIFDWGEKSEEKDL